MFEYAMLLGGHLGSILAAVMLTTLRCYPIATFARRGWLIKRDDILDSFTTDAKALYLKTFLTVDSKEPAKAFDDLYYNRYGRRIMPRSVVFTDEARIYRTLTHLGYQHSRVYHSARVYVEGEAHVNTLEGFWSLTKNGIRAVYHNVSTKHLQSYLNEYAFRFNRRKSLGRRNMFEAFTNRIRKVSSAA